MCGRGVGEREEGGSSRDGTGRSGIVHWGGGEGVKDAAVLIQGGLYTYTNICIGEGEVGGNGRGGGTVFPASSKCLLPVTLVSASPVYLCACVFMHVCMCVCVCVCACVRAC